MDVAFEWDVIEIGDMEVPPITSFHLGVDMSTMTSSIKDKMRADYISKRAKAVGAKPVISSTKVEVPTALPPLNYGHQWVHDLVGLTLEEYVNNYGKPFSARIYDEDYFSPEVRSYIPMEKENYHYRKEFFDFLMMVEMGYVGALVGESGTGKDEMVKQVAALKQQPYRRITGDRRMTSDMIVGRRTMTDGSITWEPGELQTACENGVMVAIAEPWAMPPDTLFAMQSMVERNGYLSIVEHPDPSKRMLEVHKDTRIVLTTNTRGFGDDNDKFAATGVMDASFLNRLEYMQQVPHLEPEVEASVISINVGDDILCMNMVRFGNLIRQAWRTGTIEASWSLRNLVPWSEVYARIGDIAKAFRLTYWGKLNDTEKGTVQALWRDCGFREAL